jgi:hypothetical protein
MKLLITHFFHPPATSSLLGTNNPLSALLLNTLNLPLGWDTKFHIHIKPKSKIMTLKTTTQIFIAVKISYIASGKIKDYVLPLDSRWEEKSSRTEWQ